MSGTEQHEINGTVRISGLDDALEKATALSQKINEAKTLADELASLMKGLELEVKI